MRSVFTKTGFTVLELIVALALGALLAAIAVPRLSARVPALLLDQAARNLAAEARLARIKAIARGSRARLVAALPDSSYRVEIESGGGFVAEGDERSLPSGVAFDPSASTRVSQDQVSITFQPRGHTADNATIALAAAGGLRRRVIVSPAGRVRID